ncbi:MAG: hypothetical protein RBR22_08135 [Desulfuromonas sp.]|nr:hypothetical protein [Desulfuromonas sp.]
MTMLFVQAPLVVNPALAKRIGLNEAIILQQVHYWIQRGSSGVDHDNRRWIYNTHEEWIEQFPFWSRDQIKRVFSSLKSQGVLLIDQLRKSEHIRTNYYAINYSHESLKVTEINDQANPPLRESEIASSKGANSPDRTVQIRPIDECNSASSMGANSPLLTETTTEITTETTAEITEPLATEAADATADTVGELVLAGEVSQQQPKVEIPADMPGPKDPKAKTYRVWANYAFAFRKRYNVWPVWNARTAGQLGQLVDRLGQDAAPKVAAYYLTIADARLITEQHSVNLLLARAEALHTQWATGRRINGTTARQQERTAANFEAAQTAIENINAKSRMEGIRENPFWKD